MINKFVINKRNRKRQFSLIFVPNQDQDPKSITMSYFKGLLILCAGVLLAFHLIFGIVGYFQWMRANKIRTALKQENEELKASNEQIREIEKEFRKNQLYHERLRKALGLSLEMEGEETEEEMPVPLQQPKRDPAFRTGEEEPGTGSVNTLPYLMSARESDFFNPEFMPTLLPVEGFLTTHFRKADWYVKESHNGIDIASKKGTTIRAAGAGTVLITDWTPDYGNMVIIAHGGGLYSYYGHAIRTLVHQGDFVQKGQPIALLGSSGVSSAPHLHFEIWQDGKPINPVEFIYALRRTRGGGG